MNGKKLVFSLTLCLIVITGSWAFAACPNLVGVWDVTGQGAFYESQEGYSFKTLFGGILHITKQNSCAFYGYLYDGDENTPLTGVIRGTTVTMTLGHITGIGGLDSYNSTTGRYTRILFTLSILETYTSSHQGTVRLTAKRR